MAELRRSTGRVRLALKAAVRRAVDICGGGQSVQHATRVDNTSLSRYSDPNRADLHCPLDVALDLDLEAGAPIVLAAMAEAEGYRLEKIEVTTSSSMPWCSELARHSQHSACIFEAIATALEDGLISPAEAKCILEALDKSDDQNRRIRERVRAECEAGRARQ